MEKLVIVGREFNSASSWAQESLTTMPSWLKPSKHQKQKWLLLL